jgi:hypothetical protein
MQPRGLKSALVLDALRGGEGPLFHGYLPALMSFPEALKEKASA